MSDVMHQIAYVSGGQTITKCGVIVANQYATSWASERTCEDCTPEAWPTGEILKSGFGESKQGSSFDKLIGPQMLLDQIHPSIRLPGQKVTQ